MTNFENKNDNVQVQTGNKAAGRAKIFFNNVKNKVVEKLPKFLKSLGAFTTKFVRAVDNTVNSIMRIAIFAAAVMVIKTYLEANPAETNYIVTFVNDAIEAVKNTLSNMFPFV